MSTLQRVLPALSAIAALLLGLVGTPVAGTPEASPSGEIVTWRAVLVPLNSDINGRDTNGVAIFTASGDQLRLQIEIDGVAPDIQHLQHFHGFADSDQAATCPTMDADTNGDGVVDIKETEPLVGVTMVPFTDDPVSMEIVDATYPTAGADGSYSYDQTVSLSELEQAFGDQFPGQQLDLEKRVVMVHTVPESTELPESVASLDDIPAQTTLPVTCGQIERIDGATPIASPVG